MACSPDTLMGVTEWPSFEWLRAPFVTMATRSQHSSYCFLHGSGHGQASMVVYSKPITDGECACTYHQAVPLFFTCGLLYSSQPSALHEASPLRCHQVMNNLSFSTCKDICCAFALVNTPCSSISSVLCILLSTKISIFPP